MYIKYTIYCNFLKGPVIIVSKYGGVDIEEVAAKDPDAITYLPIDINKGLTSEQGNFVADKLGLTGNGKEIVSIIACNLYELFIEKDALLLEINPLAEDICGECEEEREQIKEYCLFI